MWLSLAWPGVGHLYAGDRQTGIAVSAACALCVLIAATTVGPGLALIVWLGLALYAAIDSGRAVSGSRAR